MIRDFVVEESGLHRWEGETERGRKLIAYARHASDALALLRPHGVRLVRKIASSSEEAKLLVEGAQARETRSG
jgi:hypothetical protein